MPNFFLNFMKLNCVFFSVQFEAKLNRKKDTSVYYFALIFKLCLVLMSLFLPS